MSFNLNKIKENEFKRKTGVAASRVGTIPADRPMPGRFHWFFDGLDSSETGRF
jgi:hypothetical protein